MPGTNAAYLEQLSRLKKWTGPAVGTHMTINTEWGGFRAPSLPRVEADVFVDLNSVNPGAQTFEKMLSGLYLGRLAVRTLLQADAEAEAPFFDADTRAQLERPDSFPTPLVAAVDADRCVGDRRDTCVWRCEHLTPPLYGCLHSSSDLVTAAAALQTVLGKSLAPRTVALVKEVCHLVTRRAARLAAAGVVAVLAHMDAALPHDKSADTAPATVAVDGGACPCLCVDVALPAPAHTDAPWSRFVTQRSMRVRRAGLFEHHTVFAATLCDTVKEMGVSAVLRLTPDGSGVGAALLAAAAANKS